MTDEAISAGRALRHELFGNAKDGETMPPAYLEALRHLTDGASARLGVRLSNTERVAYWLDGHSIAALTCRGASDKDAEIEGAITRLTELRNVKIAVTVRYDEFHPISPFSRVLTMESPDCGNLVFDASPRSDVSEERRQVVETFIDAVLAALSEA